MHLFTTDPGSPVDIRNVYQQNAQVCILSPTATSAEHIRHALARQGALVRPDSIVTLSRFIEPLVSEVPLAPTAVISHLIDVELRKNPPPLFRPLAESKGLRRMLTSLMEEAGQPVNRRAGLSHAGRSFFDLFDSIASQLKERGYLLRSERLRLAAKRLVESPSPWRTICFDGFYAFTPAEFEVLAALRPAELMVTLPEWDGAEDSRKTFQAMGFYERTACDAPLPGNILVVTASSEHEECEEIAHRILRLTKEGRHFREIGIVVRREQPYVPLLRTTLIRYGIPARYYFQKTLDTHALSRYLLTLLDAVQSNWDYGRVLPLLQMPLSGLAGSSEADQLDHELRRRQPANGLPPSLQALGWNQLTHWRTASFRPAEWCEELHKLNATVRMPKFTDRVPHSQMLGWRELIAAQQAWDWAVNLTASMLDPDTAVGLTDFVRSLSGTLEHAPVSDRDQRRNVVHVLDVHEARQWRLPVVFLCGMLERAFPQYHSEHPILSDADREALRSELLLRTSAERQRDEAFLFDTAARAATGQLVLSYPRANSKGEETLPSFFLARLQRTGQAPSEEALPGRPKPRWPKALMRRAQVRDRAILTALKKARNSLSPTSIETYLQCPFQFFARHILKLNPAPAKPYERLDFLLQGNILHQTLAEAHGSPLFADEIFTRLFADACREKSVPPGCLTEKARLELEHNLQRFMESPPLSGAQTRSVERDFDLRLDEDLRIRGKIDRVVELSERGLVVIDYKYSTRDRIRDRVRSHDRGEMVQGGLYLWAAEKLYKTAAAGMLYCGLRGEVSWGGWHTAIFGWQDIGETWEQPQLREMMDRAVESSRDVAGRIANGDLSPRPADTKKCVWCEFRDSCRVETHAAPLVQVAGGGG